VLVAHQLRLLKVILEAHLAANLGRGHVQLQPACSHGTTGQQNNRSAKQNGDNAFSLSLET